MKTTLTQEVIMRYIKTMKLVVVVLLTTAVCFAENYTVSLYFEQPEEALNTLFRTQVFPHPVGDHNGDTYDIYLWDPVIDIEPGIVSFSFTIHADLVIGGTPTHYTYTFDLPLVIPSGELSINGIIAFLEGIPDQINSMDGPQWVKDIIIAEYEGLELMLYPNSLLEDANDAIPGFIDITVTDISFSWEAQTNLLRYTLSVDIDASPPIIIGQWKEDGSFYLFRFHSNVETQILFIGVYSLTGEGEDSNPDVLLIPGEWSDPVSIFWANVIPSGNYRCKVLFGSPYGWFAVCYSFNNRGESGWNNMSIASTL